MYTQIRLNIFYIYCSNVSVDVFKNESQIIINIVEKIDLLC
jgi:hypothetical protein